MTAAELNGVLPALNYFLWNLQREDIQILVRVRFMLSMIKITSEIAYNTTETLISLRVICKV